ncbi:MAG: YHS domain-containing protein [Chrysiogenales bacterium]|nr:MAG: YHS domain-containing protein [Chrysiogenales bacterium]
MTFFRFLLLAGIIYLLFKWLFKSPPPAARPRSFDRQGQAIEEMVQDPVCGTYVPAGQALPLTREKETFYFCSDECREKFKQLQKPN